MEVKDKIPALDTQLEYISKSKPKLLLTVFKLFFFFLNKYIYTIFFFAITCSLIPINCFLTSLSCNYCIRNENSGDLYLYRHLTTECQQCVVPVEG